jgi:hypothetical protein
MSAMGHKRKCCRARVMSVYPRQRTFVGAGGDVRKVSEADIEVIFMVAQRSYRPSRSSESSSTPIATTKRGASAWRDGREQKGPLG